MPDKFAEIPPEFPLLPARSVNSILLHTSRCDPDNYRSYLFLEPAQVIAAQRAEEIPEVFERVEEALRRGNFVAGYLAYECGLHFESAAAPAASESLPLAWLGVYPRVRIFNHRDGRYEGESRQDFVAPPREKSGFAVSGIRFGIAEKEYAAKIDAIHDWIRSGDTYQVNLTDQLSFGYSGSPIDLFSAIGASQPVSYSAFLNLGNRQILSFSPELFFRIRGKGIVTRPMKGTAKRGRTNAEDSRIAEWLKNDEKNRSENVMIVDLLRNDLGRICEFGSVRTEELFSVEKYDTLFQMISTVKGRLRSGVGLYEVFKSIFPCGSITGAPKIRTMQIIRQLESGPRGVYTGAIGFFAPDGDAVFNVAIRTAVLGGGRGQMGIGGGITIDSRAQDEYRECLLKAEFLTSPVPTFALIESLLWDGRQYPLLDFHLERLQDSAHYFGLVFDRERIRQLLLAEAAHRCLAGAHKVRLTLDRYGRVEIDRAAIALGAGTGIVSLCPERTCSQDRFLFHKTTHRQFYNSWFKRAQSAGCDDILFFNERGELTEGAISNVFVERDGELVTPPTECGLLAGVYRRHVLATDARAFERVLTRGELLNATQVYICNAVRGMRKVSVTHSQVEHSNF